MIDQCKYQQRNEREKGTSELIAWLRLPVDCGGRRDGGALLSPWQRVWPGGLGDGNGGKGACFSPRAGLCWLSPQQREGRSAWHELCSEFPVVYLKSVRKRKGIEQVSISHQLAWCLVSVNAPVSEVCLLLGLGSSVVASRCPSEFCIRVDGPRQGHCGSQGVAASLGRCRRMDE